MTEWTPPSRPPGPPAPPEMPAGPPTAGAPPPPPGAWAPLPGEPPPPSRRWLALLAAAVVVALAGLAAVTLLDDDDGDEEAAEVAPDPDTTAGAGTEGTGDPEEGGEPRAAQIEREVDELSSFVEDARGLEFVERVDVTLLDPDDFEERVLETLDEDLEEEDLAEGQLWMRAFEILEPGDDLETIYRELYRGSALGFYDLETKELVVRGGELTPYVRQTIVHELVHALDDQHFDIHREEVRDAVDESGFGFLAFTEGSAEHVAAAYERSLGQDEQRRLAEEELSFGAGLDLSDVPLFLLLSIVAPYEHGPELVAAIVEAGGQQRWDASFAEPPVTSEQVLDPTAYLEGEGPIEVPRPDVDGEVLDEGPLGAVFLESLFSAGLVPPATAAAAVDGWGGDASVLYRDGEAVCARAFLVGDTPQDTDELADALERWSEGHDDATVATAGERVELTVCA